MPIAHVRGVNINYEVLGTGGSWVALSPGGRRALDNVKSLAQHVADAGYRVLIHDRRNCGQVYTGRLAASRPLSRARCDGGRGALA